MTLLRRHDQFFKRLLEQPGTAGTLLRERLPAAVAARLAADPPQLIPGSFVDRHLQEYHTDRLYRVRLTDGQPALVYALVEHKSRPHVRIGLQLLTYMARIWRNWDKTEGKAEPGQRRPPLPPVLPLVVYNGDKVWDLPLSFADAQDADAALRPYMLDFRFGLMDLGRIADAALSQEVALRSGLLILKRGGRPGPLREVLLEVARVAAALGLDDLVATLRYILGELDHVDPAVLEDVLKEILPGEEATMMSITMERWKAEWTAEGMAVGEARGKAASLARLLQRRFDSVPAGIRARIEGADSAQLDVWLDNVLDAPDLESVFQPVTSA